MSRQVTIRLSSMCGTDFVHQPIYVQLSSGEAWIPPNGPLRFPPKPSTDDSPKVSVEDIANALQQAVSGAQIVGGAQVSNVSDVTKGPLMEDGVPKGSAKVFEFSFNTDDDQIDYSISGVKFTNGKESAENSQIKMGVHVGEGEEEIDVKPVGENALCGAGASGGWKKSPGEVVPKRKRKRLKKGQSGKFGEPRLFPDERKKTYAWWTSDASAFWDAHEDESLPWQPGLLSELVSPPDIPSRGLQTEMERTEAQPHRLPEHRLPTPDID